MNKLRFITSVFGDRHVNMLIPLLFSIEHSNPGAFISVYWEDIDENRKILIQKAYPQVEFIDTHFDFTTDIAKRISSKTLVWEFAAHDKQNEEGWLFFLDTDMLVLKDISPFLKSINGDIIYTFRQGQFWINSGVLACRKHPERANFFTKWREKTQAILNDPTLFAQANDKKLHYGGADQMSLQQLLNYSIEKNSYTLSIATIPLLFTGVDCEYLNETYSRPVTDKTHIIHYKGGWRDILFFGGNFTPNRPKQDSWEMYILYLQTFQKALLSLNKRLRAQYTLKNFGLSIPFYIDKNTLQERQNLYKIFIIIAWFKKIPGRVHTLFKLIFDYLFQK